MPKLLCCILLSLLLKLATAQVPPVITITPFNETNGINKGKVTAMLQGTDGFLWFGTSNGLLRYDGYSFRAFNHPAFINSISRLAADSAGHIWMSFLGGGIASFDPGSGVVRNFTIHTDDDPNLGRGEVESMFFDSKGRLWLSITQKGLIRADAEQDRYTVYNIVSDTDSRYTPVFRKVYNTVNSMAEGRDGILWLATHDGLYQFNPATGKLVVYRNPSPISTNSRLDLYTSIIFHNDVIWLGAWAGGFTKFDTRSGAWKNWLPSPVKSTSAMDNVIGSITARNEQEIWMASADLGLLLFNKETETIQHFANNPSYPGVPPNEWYQLITDKEQNLWALQREGLMKVQAPDYLFSFTALDATPVSTKGSVDLNDWWENDRYRIIATAFGDGIHVMDKQTQQTSILPVEILPNEEKVMNVEQLFEDSHKNLWVITRDFLYRFDKSSRSLIKTIQPPPYSLDRPSNGFVRATEDDDGNVWFATRRNGVFVWDHLQQRYLHYGKSEKGQFHTESDYYLTAATDKRGRIWLGSSYGFLGFADSLGGKIQSLNGGHMTGNFLPGSQTYLLHADPKGNIWAGTFYGLCHFDCSSDQPKLLRIYKAADGLRSNIVTGINEDRMGRTWCVTEVAVCRIDPTDQSVVTYDAGDGIRNSKVGVNMVPAGRDSMRLLSYGGYYTFPILEKTKQAASGPLLITRMLVKDKEFFYQDELKEKKLISLSAKDNTFSFEFAAVSFNRPSRQRYQYYLEGLDKQWIDAEGRRFISYSNLPGGNYTFRVRSFDELNSQSKNELAIPLFVKTPFYKTIYFYALLLLLLGFLLHAIYVNRMKHHRELHELQSKAQLLEREKALVMYDALKQQLNPHFLFNSLSSLSSLIQSDQQMADNFLGHLSSIYRYILKNRDKETVSVEEELRFLKQYTTLQQTRFKEGLEVHINVSEEARAAKLTPVVLQNLVENAIKHNSTDRSSPLVIEIFNENDYLIVRNNLQKKGFVETSNKQGLHNLRTLYTYYTIKPVLIDENENFFTVKIPLL